MQQFGRVGSILLKTLVIVIMLRILLFALGLKIVDYIPVIDDLIALLHKGLTAISNAGQSAVGSVVKM